MDSGSARKFRATGENDIPGRHFTSGAGAGPDGDGRDGNGGDDPDGEDDGEDDREESPDEEAPGPRGLGDSTNSRNPKTRVVNRWSPDTS